MRRATQTGELLASGEEVYIVRHFFDEPVLNPIQRQNDLVSRLSRLYPNTKFSYLWGSDFNADHINSPFGIVHHLPKASTWQGDDGAWGKRLAR